MEEKYIIEQTENSITWDYGVPVENYDEWLSGYTNTYTVFKKSRHSFEYC